jgi:hypothetical protein
MNTKQMLLPLDFPARTSQTANEELVLDWLETEADCGMSVQELSTKLCRNGLSSKTFSIYLHNQMGGDLPVFFKRWKVSGIVYRGGYWTQDISMWLAPDQERGLSEVLQTQIPQKYYLEKAKSAQWYKKNKPKEILSRCASDGTADCLSKDLDSVFLRKMTPLEQELAMGYPENWTNTDTEPLEMP